MTVGFWRRLTYGPQCSHDPPSVFFSFIFGGGGFTPLTENEASEGEMILTSLFLCYTIICLILRCVCLKARRGAKVRQEDLFVLVVWCLRGDDGGCGEL